MSTNLGIIPNNLNDKVKIIDNRPEEQKEEYRAYLSHVQRHSEDFIEPSVVEYFNYKLEQDAENTSKDITIVINQLSIYDIFPARLKASTSAALSSQGIYYADYNNLKNTDHVLIVFSGSVNGVAKEITMAEPYQVSAFTLNVYDEVDFKRALNKAIDDVVRELLN